MNLLGHLNGMYRTNINKPLKHEQKCSLLNSLSYLFKILPRNFEISTNNGKYFFNKEISCAIFPSISDAVNKTQNISQYSFDINDELNIMKKIESLFKGESADFFLSEIDEINKIITLFEDQIFNITLIQESQEQISFKINLKLLFELLQQMQDKPFKIKTNKRTYSCNILGIMISNYILTFLKANPNSTELNFDYPDENYEFHLICDYFNFKEINITSDNIDSLQIISEQLEINPVIKLINETYDKYDENFQKSEENQKLIDPYSELFEYIFNINQIGIEKVADFILHSTWVNSESEVQELVSCFCVVIKADISIQKSILDLVFLLSETKDQNKELSILIPFLTDVILKEKDSGSNYIISFIYLLYRRNIISINCILKMISSQFIPNIEQNLERNFLFQNANIFFNCVHKSTIKWFFPEIVEYKLINEKLQLEIQKEIPYIDSNTITVEQMKKSRDNYVEKDSIILAIKNDDVDTFQYIVTTSGIDIKSKKIKVPIYDSFSGEISFIDYAAAYGSIKCFKYLFLNNASIDFHTFTYSIFGRNVEIIRIIDQNKNDFDHSHYRNEYEQPSSMNHVFNAAIQIHEYKIFDWLFEQNNLDSEKDLFDLLQYSIKCGNAYSMLVIIQKIADLNKLQDVQLYELIKTTCNSRFYQILKFLTHLINFHDLTDPTKGDHSDLTDVSNRRIKIKQLNTELLKSSVDSGMKSIFELILKETGIKYSKCMYEALIEAAKTNNLCIVKYILENKLYQLSDLFKIKIITQSISSDSQDVTNYFFEKEVIVNSEFLESACSAQNIKLVKLIVQTANEKQISLDFTLAFINAVCSYSEEICRYFIEMKVPFNYQKNYNSLYNIIKINPKIIILLIENANDEIKDDIITQSINAALSSRKPEIFEYLFKIKANLNGLLIQSIYESDSATVKAILEYNHSPEFINQIGQNETALHAAIIQHKDDIVEYLLQLPGIDPSISIDSINTPLVEAVKANNIKALDLIINFYGDSIKDQGIQIQNAFKLISNKRSKRQNNNFGFLHRMFHHPDTERVIYERLLDIKINFNITDAIEGKDLLFDAIKEDLLFDALIENDEKKVIELLSLESTNLKQKLQNGNTYLHIAIVGKELTPIQKLLINHPDIDINSQNTLSETPLIKAVLNDNIDLVELILSHPKFDPKLSLLDYAFYLSISYKNIARRLLKVDSIDVNYQDKQLKLTPLIRAIKLNDIELVELIIHHPTFDPLKSRIKSCLFNSVIWRNLNLFRFLLKLNGNEINIRDDKNVSLLGRAALVRNNAEILNEILNNENFDPVKSDIQTSFLNSNNQEAMKILISYDEKHGNHISFDQIESRVQLDSSDKSTSNKSFQYLLRKKEIVPKIHPICTSVISKHSRLNQQMYSCKTCEIDGICEICAKVCHKNHELEKITNKSSRNSCNCSTENHQCKCLSTQVCSDDDEIYDDIPISLTDKSENTRNTSVIHHDNIRDRLNDIINRVGIQNNRNNTNIKDNDNEEEEENELNSNQLDDEDHSFDCLRCSLDLSRFRPILQIMYRCKKCQIDICQNCAIRCHKGHPLIYKGLTPDSLCFCKDVNDCKCTDRKTVICNYLFYGAEFIYQPWFVCLTCGTSGGRGCCAACSKRCHKGHNVSSKGISHAFCDCGPTDLGHFCQCMKFPPFNYLTCCTNRNQNYIIQQQRMYHCFTCGITSENQGICESCALHCHYGHKVFFVGVRPFACECATVDIYLKKTICNAFICPEMNINGICSRLNKNSDAIFAKFVCLTCDKEGKKSFCEACAVRCHMNHDVHLVEYSNFECQCEHCKCIENESI